MVFLPISPIIIVNFALNDTKMATLKIYNDIQTEQDKKLAAFWGDAEGVCFKDIDEFCSSIPEDDGKIDLRLHCDGGSVTEGWAMYDRLRATGKEITATIEGNCSSMATVVLMAAPKERRRAYANAHICVHNPWMCPWGLGTTVTADDLQKYADDLRAEQDRLVTLYVDRCGCSSEEIQAVMNEDRYMNTDEALELGIIGDVLPPMSAYKKTNIDKMNKQNEMVEVKASKLDRLLAKLGFKTLDEFDKSEIVGMELNTASGDKLDIQRDGGEPEVGDVASPNGSHLMPDGKTIVVENGVITAINQPQGDGDGKKGDKDDGVQGKSNAETQALLQRVKSLEKENGELKERVEKAEKNAKTIDDLQVLNAVKMAGGIEVLAKISSNYTPSKRQPSGKQASERTEGITAEAILAKYKEMTEKNKKEQ